MECLIRRQRALPPSPQKEKRYPTEVSPEYQVLHWEILPAALCALLWGGKTITDGKSNSAGVVGSSNSAPLSCGRADDADAPLSIASMLLLLPQPWAPGINWRCDDDDDLCRIRWMEIVSESMGEGR